MALRSKMFKVALATAAGLVIGVGMQTETEASGYRYLCMASPSACEYAPSTAPQLNADVCYQLGTGITTIKTGTCPTGSYPFYVDAGEVINPTTGVVQPYIALPDACAMGYCIEYDPNLPPGEEGAMCCTAGGGCEPTDGICPAAQFALWCKDGQEGVFQNGEWICKPTE